MDIAGDFYGTLLLYFITRKTFDFPSLPLHPHPHKVFTGNKPQSRGVFCLSSNRFGSQCLQDFVFSKAQKKGDQELSELSGDVRASFHLLNWLSHQMHPEDKRDWHLTGQIYVFGEVFNISSISH